MEEANGVPQNLNLNQETITKDVNKPTINGFIGLFFHTLLGLFIIVLFIAIPEVGWLFNILIFGPIWTIYCNSYVVIHPNEGAAVLFFGKYSGTVKTGTSTPRKFDQ